MTDKKCVCGCGQSLEGRGANFASPACVLRAMLKSPDLAKAFGEDNLKAAIALHEAKEKKARDDEQPHG